MDCACVEVRLFGATNLGGNQGVAGLECGGEGAGDDRPKMGKIVLVLVFYSRVTADNHFTANDAS